MDRHVKISASILLLLLAAGVIFSHKDGAFFPWLPGAAFVGLSIVALTFLFGGPISHRSAVNFLGILIVFSVLYRTFIFTAPASLVGIDPNLYATWVRKVVLEGSVEAIQNPFYSNISGSIVLPAMTAIVSDVSSMSALIVYPVLAGILTPLTGFVFYRRLATTPSNHSALITAMIATITATSVRYSYIPIAQLPSGLLVAIFVIVLIVQMQSDRQTFQYIMILVLVLLGLAITHKLGLFLVVGALALCMISVIAHQLSRSVVAKFDISVSLLITALGISIIAIWGLVVSLFASPLFAFVGVCSGGILLYRISNNGLTSPNQQPFRIVRGFLLIATVILVVQWVYLSRFIRSFLINTIGVLLSYSQPTSVAPNLQAAVRASSGILSINGSWANVLLPLLLVALVIVALTLHGSEREGTEIGMGFMAVALVLAPSSLIAANSAGINAARLLIGLNSLLFAFVVIGFTRDQHGQIWRAGVGIVFVVLLANQAFAVQSTPDYPGSSRLYLETDEVEAMEFALTHTNTPIYTDRLATFHRISLLHPAGEAWKYDNSQFRAITTGYANHTLITSNKKLILQRSIDIYLLDVPGYWNLTWNPMAALERNRSKVYTTSDTALFYNSTV